MKSFTHGAGIATMILVAQRMGLAPAHVPDATGHLEGGEPHPMTSAAMEREAVSCNERLRHDAAMVTKANVLAELVKAEFGFLAEISKEAHLELQAEAESLLLACAQGQDLPEHDGRLLVIDRLTEASPWTLHPDYGCILKTDVELRDRMADITRPRA